MPLHVPHLPALGRATLAAAFAGGALLASAGPAAAASTAGSAGTPTTPCSAKTTAVQQTSSSTSPSYAIPDGGGVITAWSYQAKANPGQRKLKVFANTGTSGQFKVVGESALETGAANTLNTFATRIPVSGGERIGFFTPTGDDGCRQTAGSGDQAAGRVGSDDQPVGASFSSTFYASSTLLDIAVSIEPDADGDGYGDETQDQCVGDPAVFATPCQADVQVTLSAAPDRVKLGDAVTYTATVSNTGPTSARAVTLTQVLPAGAPLVSASAGCKGFAKVTCSAGDLPSGARPRVFTLTIRAPEPGPMAMTATARSNTFDPIAANNSASANVTVDPRPFRGAPVRDGTFHARRGAVPLPVSCPVAARRCSGTLVLRAGRTGRGRKLGHARFVIYGGRRHAVRVKLSARTLRMVAGHRRTAARATVTAADRFGQRATTRASIFIRPPRR